MALVGRATAGAAASVVKPVLTVFDVDDSSDAPSWLSQRHDDL